MDVDELAMISILEDVCDPSSVPNYGKNVVIRYKNSTYHGEIHNHVPHGFGTLYEDRKTTLGWWMLGIFKSGLVIEYKSVPSMMKQDKYVKRAILWHNKTVIQKS